MKNSITKTILVVIVIGSFSFGFTTEKKTSNKITKPLASSLVFWTKNCSYGPIEIYVDNRYYGDITQCYSSQPQCASSGCVTVVISGPNNYFRAQTKDGRYKWNSKPATFNSNTCNGEELL